MAELAENSELKGINKEFVKNAKIEMHYKTTSAVFL